MYYNSALRTSLAADWLRASTPSPKRLLHSNQFISSKMLAVAVVWQPPHPMKKTRSHTLFAILILFTFIKI